MNAPSASALDIRRPIDGTVVGSVPVADATRVQAITADLRAAQTEWRDIGPAARAVWLRRWRTWILEHTDELTDMLVAETGKVRPDALVETTASCEFISYYADHAKAFLAPERIGSGGLLSLPKRLTRTYRPYPVVGLITPWNFPITLFLMDAAPALAAGCAVLTKSSEMTPLTCARVIEGWHEIGAPPVLAHVAGPGETGAEVLEAADFVQFTGSTATGRRVATRCAELLKPVSLELGGKDAAIVLEDADLDRAAHGIAWGGMFNSGQVCISVERVYVVDQVYDRFVEKLATAVGSLRQGSGTRDDVGAMVTRAQVDTVERHVEDARESGARVLVGGARGAQGNFYAPTLLVDVDHRMACMTEETFGPTLPVMRAADEEEAVRLANDSEYGLSATVWTRDVERGRRIADRLDVGAVNVNDVFSNLFAVGLPHSGWKSSGLGARLGGAQGLRKYCRVQAITEPRIPLTTKELTWYPYSARRAAIAGRVLRLAAGRGLRQRLGV
ncbi:aldehyde dehydrogenase family protein [Nocardioides sp. TRM66260-LWL]|uniref:aldehyde dehydrogenase family protein n=1 Tax=Nocardioides sp. TRM66260-LWL TaxID=2874478 RepID=UPI001CC757A7|nr:aldehyde dehydrogenase family protein [Nocardioides sp. TRM66260-LWL]MBZ5733493.1 aldehyde dehydrogenase family protein [Nocardioides sp. TRM66260-LWL]